MFWNGIVDFGSRILSTMPHQMKELISLIFTITKAEMLFCMGYSICIAPWLATHFNDNIIYDLNIMDRACRLNRLTFLLWWNWLAPKLRSSYISFCMDCNISSTPWLVHPLVRTNNLCSTPTNKHMSQINRRQMQETNLLVHISTD